MNIITVQNFNGCYKVTLGGGTILIVPIDADNTDYQKVLAWINAGGAVSAGA